MAMGRYLEEGHKVKKLMYLNGFMRCIKQEVFMTKAI